MCSRVDAYIIQNTAKQLKANMFEKKNRKLCYNANDISNINMLLFCILFLLIE